MPLLRFKLADHPPPARSDGRSNRFVTQGLTNLDVRDDTEFMISNPRGDNSPLVPSQRAEWIGVLAHRSPDAPGFDEVVERLIASDITPGRLQEVLADGGDALYAAAASGEENWTDAFGGPLTTALLAAEVSSLAAHLNSRASGVRSVAVDQLLDEYSAVTVAVELGVSRQKVYEIARSGLKPPYLDQVPWRKS